MKIMVSSFFRGECPESLKELSRNTSGTVTPIPQELVASRQIDLFPPKDGQEGYELDAVIRKEWHRDVYEDVMERDDALRLVAEGKAEWVPQLLLCYPYDTYVTDKHVKANEEELARVQSEQPDKVIVAIISPVRGLSSTLRNYADGIGLPEDPTDAVATVWHLEQAYEIKKAWNTTRNRVLVKDPK